MQLLSRKQNITSEIMCYIIINPLKLTSCNVLYNWLHNSKLEDLFVCIVTCSSKFFATVLWTGLAFKQTHSFLGKVVCSHKTTQDTQIVLRIIFHQKSQQLSDVCWAEVSVTQNNTPLWKKKISFQRFRIVLIDSFETVVLWGWLDKLLSISVFGKNSQRLTSFSRTCSTPGSVIPLSRLIKCTEMVIKLTDQIWKHLWVFNCFWIAFPAS